MDAMQGRRVRGFTLIEVLVVIAIIAVLAGMLMPALHKAMIRARVAKVRGELENLQTAIELYASETGTFPQHESAEWASELYPLYVKQLIDAKHYSYGQAQKLRDPFCAWTGQRQFYRYYSAREGSLDNGENVPAMDSYVVFSVGPDGDAFGFCDGTGAIDEGKMTYLFDLDFIDLNHDGENDFSYTDGMEAPNNPSNPEVQQRLADKGPGDWDGSFWNGGPNPNFSQEIRYGHGCHAAAAIYFA